MNENLQNALRHLWEAKPTIIKNREYDTVSTRVAAFRRNFPLDQWRIRTKLSTEGDMVMCHAKIQHRLPMYATEDYATKEVTAVSSWQTISEGHAEEKRGSGVNKEAAIENCETSAVGRALAFLGLGGSEVCSADELGLVTEHSDEFLELDKLETREELREAFKAMTKEARDRVTPEEIKTLNDKFGD